MGMITEAAGRVAPQLTRPGGRRRDGAEGPTRLANAHASLNRAVFAAYGWPAIPDEDILKNLLALNLERSGGG